MSEHLSSDSSLLVEEASNLQFPWKLHLLLKDCESNELQTVISWLPNGVAFKVHDKPKFSTEVMPRYFQSNKYKSFQRNLNLWGFQTETKDPNRGAIYHPCFVKGQTDRCHMMKRVKVKKGSALKQAKGFSTTPKSEPNLHQSVGESNPLSAVMSLATLASQGLVHPSLISSPNQLGLMASSFSLPQAFPHLFSARGQLPGSQNSAADLLLQQLGVLHPDPVQQVRRLSANSFRRSVEQQVLEASILSRLFAGTMGAPSAPLSTEAQPGSTTSV